MIQKIFCALCTQLYLQPPCSKTSSYPTVSAYRLLNEAQLEILAFQRALKECVLSVDDAYGKSFEEFYVGFEGRLAEFSDVTLETVNIQ